MAGLTIKELKELARRQGLSARSGEYIPRGSAPAVGQPVSGLLGADPVVDYRATSGSYEGKPGSLSSRPALEGPTVSTQQQSGYREPKAGRTFYTNSAGQTGTSVPKGSGTSGVYDAAKAPAGAAGRGLLSRLGGAIAGPVGMGAQAALMPGDLGNSDQRTPQQGAAEFVKNNPEAAASAAQWAQGVSGRAAQAGMAPVRGGTVQPMPQPQATPEVPQEQAAVVQEKQEAQRQFVEKKVYEAVDQQKISRPEIAKAVVKADQARSGTELSKEDEAKAIKEETSFLRGMDKAEVSKYLSYALIAGGIYAGFADESGQAGQMFVQAYDNERARQAADAIRKEDKEAAAAAAALKQANKERELDQGDRGLDIKGAAAEGLAAYRDSSLSLQAAAEQRKAAGQGARLSLEEQRLAHQMSQDAVRNGLLADKNAILATKAAKADGPRGLDISTKDATTQITEWAKSQDVDIDPATAQAVGAQLQFVLKNNPTQYAMDPSGTINGLLQANRTTKEPGPIRGLFGADPSKAYVAPGLIQ